MAETRGFVSDNCSGVHPELLAAVSAANPGHAASYGADPATGRFAEAVRSEFGERAVGFPMLNGTGANVAAIRAMSRPHQAVICAETGHLNIDETAAPEAIAGVKLLAVSSEDGKLTPESIEARMPDPADVPHAAWPTLVSIAQATEVGTAYTPAEVEAIAGFCHGREMLLHMDGARLANVAAAAGLSLDQASLGCGVDALTFGATKNGAMYGEAVIFADPAAARGFEVLRKGSLQLGSKMRFISAQLVALLTDGLWREIATAANSAAAALADAIAWTEGVDLVQPVEANILFIAMDLERAERFAGRCRPHEPLLFPVGETGVVRLVASWDSTVADVDALIADLTASAEPA